MKIVKLDYSSNPWRLVDDTGAEVWIKSFEYIEGVGLVNGPICGPTKKAATKVALSLLHRMLKLQDAALRNGTI